uniref:Uncharacterized protein n=1 Tax=Cajanus cajan TaxID=3821 RepID=A0A151R7S9_CAJCA|nr:hypothetical protein KK1_040146 [Cajanus cajan]
MSEEEDEGEDKAMDLLLGRLPEKQTQSTSQTQTLTQSKKPQTSQSHYVPKNKILVIVQMQPEFWDKNPNKENRERRALRMSDCPSPTLTVQPESG